MWTTNRPKHFTKFSLGPNDPVLLCLAQVSILLGHHSLWWLPWALSPLPTQGLHNVKFFPLPYWFLSLCWIIPVSIYQYIYIFYIIICVVSYL